MTDIQIKYFDYVEGKRHNIVTEGETIKHNRQTESQALNELVETRTHNRNTEGLTQQTINENVRHNLQSESIGRTQANAARLSAQAGMLSASAAMQNAATNASNLINQTKLTESQVAYNKSKTKGQDIRNAVEGYGIGIKKASSVISSVGNAASSVTKPISDIANISINMVRAVGSLIPL